MRRYWFAALISVWLALPGPAAAETCTSNSSFDWGIVTGGDWVGAPCTASAGDHFIIAAGHTVTITGDILQDTTAGIGIVVQSGGTLTTNVTADGFEVRLGNLGLHCQAGSTCTFRGGFRKLGTNVALATPATTPQEWRVGELFHCPAATVAGDCNQAVEADADQDQIRIDWSTAIYDAADGLAQDYFLPDAMVEVTASAAFTEDVACFYDPDPTDEQVPSDIYACYPITAEDQTAADYSITLSLVTSRVQEDYPDARKGIVKTTLGAAVGVGDRDITIDDTNSTGRSVAADGDLTGRWLRFEDADGNPEPSAYLIRHYDSAAGDDVVSLAHLGGSRRSYPLGREVHIDYGWKRGDPFFIMTPIHFTSATAAEGDSKVEFDGTTVLNGVVFHNADSFSVDGPIESQYTYLRDTGDAQQYGRLHRAVIFETNAAGHIRNMFIVGGNADVTYEPHVIDFRGNAAVVFDGLRVRFHEDDTVNPTADTPNPLIFKHFISEMVEGSGGSVSMIDTGAFAACQVLVTDAACIDCTEGEVDIGATVGLSFGDCPSRVANFLSLNNSCSFSTANYFEWSDVYRIGGEQIVGCNAATIVPARVTNAVIQDVGNTSTSFYPGISHTNYRMRNTVVLGFGTAEGQMGEFRDGDVWENNVLYNLNFTHVAPSQFFDWDPITSGSFEHNVIVNDRDFSMAGGAAPNYWAAIFTDSTAGLRFGWNLFAFIDANIATLGFSAGNWDVIQTGPNCFIGDSNKAPSFEELPGQDWRGRAPAFIHNLLGRYDSAETPGCGLRRPAGICHTNWTHRVFDLPEVCVGPRERPRGNPGPSVEVSY